MLEFKTYIDFVELYGGKNDGSKILQIIYK